MKRAPEHWRFVSQLKQAIDPATAIAVLQFTGGTTGAPKAAMLTHAGVYANAVQSSRWFALVRSDAPESVLGVLPLFHVFAMTCVMNFSLIRGAAMILVPRFQVKSLLRTIHRKKPTAMPVVRSEYSVISSATDLPRTYRKSITPTATPTAE